MKEIVKNKVKEYFHDTGYHNQVITMTRLATEAIYKHALENNEAINLYL